MQPYSKIDTIFERNDKFRVDTTKLRRPVYSCISTWVVSEKVDGMNARILFQRDFSGNGPDMLYDVRGKTNNASIPPQLLAHCKELATNALYSVSAIMSEHNLDYLTLYGEGYGAKIQSGSRYRTDQGFILFDVGVGTRSDVGPDSMTYLSDEQVTKTADALNIPRVPIIAEEMSIGGIVELVSTGFASKAATDPTLPAEGIVARTIEPLYDNRGERLIIKLKTKDFKNGKR
jgi:hypothetical protein